MLALVAVEGGSSMGSSISSALSSLSGDVVSTLGSVAPEAFKVLGIFIAWKIGIKFYRTLTRA